MSYNYALRPGTTQKINTNNSSAASSAFGSQTEYIRIVGSANFHFVLVLHLLQVQHQLYYHLEK